MTNFKKKIASAIAAGGLLLNLVTPALATTLEISGNGTSSSNEVKLEVEQNTEVFQTNVADVYNEVNADANTGKNDANDNTGGDVSIDTGDAKVLVDVTNSLNSNVAEVDCCPTADVDVLISGNGSDTWNKVDLSINEDEGGTTIVQTNLADVTNKVDADANTGKNDANDNTGGSVSIDTGDALVGVSLSTSANSNSATVGGSDSEGTSLSARIIGNGTNSDNLIDIEYERNLALFQTNVADIFNGVWADADTGKNDANDNTGGDVSIDTGEATVGVTIDNMVNFNWADVDCGCLFDVLAKIVENGSDSWNKISADLDDNLIVAQGNCADGPGAVGLENNHREECETESKVWADADTGKNDTNDNTDGGEGVDPSIDTGDASTGVEIENSGNVNVFGDGFDFPELPDFEWDFDLGSNWFFLWTWFSGMSG